MGNWNIGINVAGAADLDPTQAFTPLAKGVYRVDIVGSERHTDNGKDSIEVDVVVDGGKYQGVKRKVWMHNDMSKDFNRKHWGALLGVVNPAAKPQLQAGAVNISASFIEGKKAFVFVNPPAEAEKDGKKQFDDVLFISQERVNILTPVVGPVNQPNAAGAAPAASSNGTTSGVNATPPSAPANLAGLAGAAGGIPSLS